MEVTATVSAFIPSILLRVLEPVASAVPAAAESVTSEEAEWVRIADATGNDSIVREAESPRTRVLYRSALTTWWNPIPSPIK